MPGSGVVGVELSSPGAGVVGVELSLAGGGDAGAPESFPPSASGPQPASAAATTVTNIKRVALVRSGFWIEMFDM